jgi:tetratricopeptide (TPR) repeat protein
VARGSKTPPSSSPVPTADAGRRARRSSPSAIAADELARAAGPERAPKLGQRLAEATRAFERERYPEARTLLRPLAERSATRAPAVREFYGLILYRMGKWAEAARELEAFRALTGSTEQNPVLADCERALRHWDRVDELWDELRAASPSAELVAEGRIVAAGARADRGDVAGAIRLLEAGSKSPRRLRPHDLRLLYALADLRERAGDVPAARLLFQRVAAANPDFADVGIRLRTLR